MSQATPRRTPTSRIDISQPAETGYWAHKFGCTHEQLHTAVKTAGPDAAAVTRYFLRVAARKQPLAA